MKNTPRFLVLAVCTLALGACDTVRETVGLDRTGPDEYSVTPSAPLTIPPDYTLRPPTPGAERPQAVRAKDRAKNALLGGGDAAAPAAAASTPGSAESSLIQRSKSYATQPAVKTDAIPQPSVNRVLQREEPASAPVTVPDAPAGEPEAAVQPSDKPLWQRVQEAPVTQGTSGPQITLETNSSLIGEWF